MDTWLSKIDADKSETIDMYELFNAVGLSECLPAGRDAKTIHDEAMENLLFSIKEESIDLGFAFELIHKIIDISHLDDCHTVPRKDLALWNEVHDKNPANKNKTG